MSRNSDKCITLRFTCIFVNINSFHVNILCFLNHKVRIDVLHLLFDQDFLYIRTFVVVVFDAAVVVDDFLGYLVWKL